MKNKYPQCEKLSEVHEERMIISNFLEWMCDKTGMFICERTSYKGCVADEFFPTGKSHDDLLMEYFKIDKKKLDNERRTILEEQRQLNKK